MSGTKQIRLSHPEQIRNRIGEFVGKKINLVLTDNRVIIGELNKVRDTGIDLLNMRLKRMQYPFEKIVEVYYDVIV